MLHHSRSIFIGVNQHLINVEIGRAVSSVIKNNKWRLLLLHNDITLLAWWSCSSFHQISDLKSLAQNIREGLGWSLCSSYIGQSSQIRVGRVVPCICQRRWHQASTQWAAPLSTLHSALYNAHQHPGVQKGQQCFLASSLVREYVGSKGQGSMWGSFGNTSPIRFESTAARSSANTLPTSSNEMRLLVEGEWHQGCRNGGLGKTAQR